jgi:hypothetical protein
MGIQHAPAGLDPAPRRSGPTWREFLTEQAQGLIACDFVHIDLVDLRRVYALVFLEHGTRRLHVAGITAYPTAAWTMQQADLTNQPLLRTRMLGGVINEYRYAA